ncbi:MAG: TPM domain-containing protein [Steroidobacteraceae bacterium]|nr:TPM domain-containing protein [Steroidobacteraceae bacterium]MDW8258094.1 TPM domain-containing protein [Gammaproteobacteria bacterium]
MRLRQTLRHLLAVEWLLRRRFNDAVLRAIEERIGAIEARHAGEIRFVVEAALDWRALWAGISPRERALQVFGLLGVWDTADNNGILIYVLLAEHAVEIVADRGIAAKVIPAEWAAVSRTVEDHYRAGRFLEGSLAAIDGVGTLLQQHFPHRGADRNELPDQPVLI